MPILTTVSCPYQKLSNLSNRDEYVQEQQSALEAAVVFLDSVVTQVSAAHLHPERAPSPGILRELEQLLAQVALCNLLCSVQASCNRPGQSRPVDLMTRLGEAGAAIAWPSLVLAT